LSGWRIIKCHKNEKVAFADELRELSYLTWQQTRKAPQQGLVAERMPQNQMKVPILIARNRRCGIPAHLLSPERP
jgi:hypothetical protein